MYTRAHERVGLCAYPSVCVSVENREKEYVTYTTKQAHAHIISTGKIELFCVYTLTHSHSHSLSLAPRFSFFSYEKAMNNNYIHASSVERAFKLNWIVKSIEIIYVI